jgi:putative ATP-binding cassette transporter
LSSLSWTVEVSVVTWLFVAVVAAILMRTTAWGRGFRALTLRYFIPGASRASWLPVVTLAAMFSISIVGVRIQVLDSFFQNNLYTALQDRSKSEFYASLKVFGAIAGVNIVQVVAEYYEGYSKPHVMEKKNNARVASNESR